MKKTLATIAIALTATTASADMSNPVSQMKVDNLFEGMVPVIKLASACDTKLGIVALEDTMDRAYKYADDEFDKQMIHIAYQKADLKSKMDSQLRSLVNTAKKNPEHPEVLKMCKEIKSEFAS